MGISAGRRIPVHPSGWVLPVLSAGSTVVCSGAGTVVQPGKSGGQTVAVEGAQYTDIIRGTGGAGISGYSAERKGEYAGYHNNL